MAKIINWKFVSHKVTHLPTTEQITATKQTTPTRMALIYLKLHSHLVMQVIKVKKNEEKIV